MHPLIYLCRERVILFFKSQTFQLSVGGSTSIYVALLTIHVLEQDTEGQTATDEQTRALASRCWYSRHCVHDHVTSVTVTSTRVHRFVCECIGRNLNLKLCA